MKSAKKFLVFLFISYVIVLAINLIANYPYYAAGGNWKFSVFFSLGMATFCGIWFGGINTFMFKRWKWSSNSNPTLMILAASLIFAAEGASMMVIVMKVMVFGFHVREFPMYDYVNNGMYAAFISMIIGLMVTGQIILTNLKKNIEDTERMKQEMIQSQYETLKNQVNPHFLFNSLNTLTVMIPQQPAMAVSYVEQMSKVFRYSLQHSSENTVDLSTELSAVKSYIFLNQQRFGEKLRVSINIDEAALQHKVITQSLLMLVENAIKHNEISHERPLAINIYNEGKNIVVQNTLQRKTLIEKSTGIGLDNIRKRYEMASPNPVVVDESNNQFTVKIPLL